MDIQSITIKIIDKFTNTLLQVEELTQPKAPKLVFNGSDDKYQPIMAAEFSFNLYVKDNADGKFFHLYTGNERRYYVTVETQDDELLFEGWLLPDFYSEPFTNSVMFVNLSATDGIGGLKAHYLDDSFYTSESSVVKLLAECLKKTGLEKKIYLAPSIMSAATDYLWHEIAVDGNSYLEDEIQYKVFGFTELPARKNCYEIIELLCKTLGLTLYGWGDTWFFEGINRKHEETQSVYHYDFKGEYIGVVSTTKNVVDVNNRFLKEPMISIDSPWKIVSVEWEIDEDGVLVPDWAIEDITTGTQFQLYWKKDMFDFWKSSGQLTLQSFSKELRTKYQLFSGWTFDLGSSVAPYHLYVVKRLLLAGVVYGETAANLETNYISIKNKKYLKTSDEWMDRSLNIEINLNAGDRFTISGIPDITEGEYSEMFKFDILSNNTKILSSKNGVSVNVSKKFDCKFQARSIQYSPNIQVGDYYEIVPDTIKSKMKAEGVFLQNNGFFDIKLHAPISPSPTASRFYGYVVESITAKYTEEKKRKTELKRNIDHTTSIKVDCFHGDSIQDLSIKQFRFRRPIYSSIIGLPNLTISAYQQLFPNYPEIFHYWITQTDMINIGANPDLFLVNFGGQDIYFSELESGSGYVWSINVTLSGIILQIDTTSINHPSGIGSNITDFLNMGFADSEVYISGYEVEDNEWRESWKRFGITENRRFGECLGRVYHDVQPGPIAKIEGEIVKIISPREILAFEWMENKFFVPTRLTIDFTEGMTNVLLNETKIESVNDYVN